MWSRGAVLRMVHADSWFKWLEDFLISHSLYLPKNNPNTKPKFCFTYLINRVINDLDTNSIYTDDTVSTMFYPDFVTLSSRYLILKTPSQGHLRTVCYEIQLI